MCVSKNDFIREDDAVGREMLQRSPEKIDKFSTLEQTSTEVSCSDWEGSYPSNPKKVD
jgi:hypothetical protein